MAMDPLGLVGRAGGGIGPGAPLQGISGANKPGGSEFKQMLQDQLNQVNQLQNSATRAIEDLATGRRDDVESVIVATQTADTAFRMLVAVRNTVMDAYEELKQMRI